MTNAEKVVAKVEKIKAEYPTLTTGECCVKAKISSAWYYRCRKEIKRKKKLGITGVPLSNFIGTTTPIISSHFNEPAYTISDMTKLQDENKQLKNNCENWQARYDLLETENNRLKDIIIKLSERMFYPS